MGRYVYEAHSTDPVWKYWFAVQNSNQHLIHTIMRVGTVTGRKYVEDPDNEDDWEYVECAIDDNESSGDVLCLTHADIPTMQLWVDSNPPSLATRQIERELGNRFSENNRQRSGMQELAFYEMVKAYIAHMEANPRAKHFIFDGEY